jgi:hypothetical protein
MDDLILAIPSWLPWVLGVVLEIVVLVRKGRNERGGR